MYDLHTHTLFSDGKGTVDDMCLSAIEKGLNGIAITDHADMNVFAEKDTASRMKQAAEAITIAKETYRDRLHVFCGVELGEYALEPTLANKLLFDDVFSTKQLDNTHNGKLMIAADMPDLISDGVYVYNLDDLYDLIVLEKRLTQLKVFLKS